MKNTRKLFALVIIASLMSACSEKTMDVEYYIAHPEERNKKLAECRNNPGEKAKLPNCQNASRAEYQSMFRGEKMPEIK
jgi:hypothetical protein